MPIESKKPEIVYPTGAVAILPGISFFIFELQLVS